MLGVGLLYQPVLDDLLLSPAWPADYLEVIPDTLWRDAGASASPRFVVDDDTRRLLETVRQQMPVLLHGIGLSIGSAGTLDEEYVEQLVAWAEWLDSPWVSEHLAYCTTAVEGEPVNVGLTLPVAMDQATVDHIGPRVRSLGDRLARPFLLENNVYYFSTPDEELTEPDVLNQLSRTWGASMLLDLHNLYVNVRNGAVEADRFIASLDLDAVREIHIAGGMELDGFYVDAHSGAPPREVWDLLDAVVPACPNLGGVTFELLGSWFDDVGRAGIVDVVERARRSLDSLESALP
jgi:uncharacterized protein (UPF0276 family)